MPSVKVLIWNIQNFGANGVVHDNYKGLGSALQVAFIADVVQTNAIDVLMIIEVMPSAGPSLDNLMYALNANVAARSWCYDWIKGAVDQRAAAWAERNVRTRAHLNFKGSGFAPRREGYAVFWRDDQGARFRMRDVGTTLSEGQRHMLAYGGAPVAHAISLSLEGRDFNVVRPSPGVQANAGFDAAAPGAGWRWSRYPDVSRYANQTPQWQRSRRPAYCVLELPSVRGAAAARVVPIIAYHAPSGKALARMGTYLSSLARELYAIPHAGAVIAQGKVGAGGDYNVVATDANEWARAFPLYTAALGRAWNSGAGTTALSSAAAGGEGTILSLRRYRNGKPTGPPITTNDLADYRRRAIDNLFHRGFANPQANVLLLPDDVFTNGAYTGAALRAWHVHLDGLARLIGNIDANLGPRYNRGTARRPRLVQVFPSMTNWTAFMAGLAAGEFRGNVASGRGADARQAAVFIHDFVSDHLPVELEFDVP